MQDVCRLKRRTWQDGARFDVRITGRTPATAKQATQPRITILINESLTVVRSQRH
jgi:hypothetical protein